MLLLNLVDWPRIKTPRFSTLAVLVGTWECIFLLLGYDILPIPEYDYESCTLLLGYEGCGGESVYDYGFGAYICRMISVNDIFSALNKSKPLTSNRRANEVEIIAILPLHPRNIFARCRSVVRLVVGWLVRGSGYNAICSCGTTTIFNGWLWTRVEMIVVVHESTAKRGALNRKKPIR